MYVCDPELCLLLLQYSCVSVSVEFTMRNVFPAERSDVPTASRDAFDIYYLFFRALHCEFNKLPSRNDVKGPESTGCFENDISISAHNLLIYLRFP